MRYTRVIEGFSCNSCGKHKEFLPTYKLWGFGSFTDTECRCGGEYERALECMECGGSFAESLGVEHEGVIYCPECRARCVCCDGVFYTEDTVEDRDIEGKRICLACRAEEAC